ncbi:MAG: metallophosphoesterase [Candidatus Hermodarchaeota archaeon]
MTDKTFLNEIIRAPYKISELKFQYISQILGEAVEIFKEENLLLEFNFDDSNSELYVIGDIHGNLDTLMRLIEIIGKENPELVIFLGDIVDRGIKQLECLILILALKIRYPNKYYLLRGNHETLEMNQNYGFFQDFISKFNDQKKFDEILALYNTLPFCALINKSILCLHGGIPEDIAILKKISGLKLKDNVLLFKSIAKSLMQIMWNDPKSELKGFSESFRGPGIKFFGEDVFDGFMKEYGLNYLIRSHEIFPEGFKWFFKKRLLSIFSSANYRGKFAPNPASYAIIRNNLVFPKLIE